VRRAKKMRRKDEKRAERGWGKPQLSTGRNTENKDLAEQNNNLRGKGKVVDPDHQILRKKKVQDGGGLQLSLG